MDVVKLDVSNQNLLQLLPQFLPLGLTHLYCDGNLLTSLPTLPSSLKSLSCFKNQLTGLPDLPDGLESLHCNNNLLTVLPDLPNSIKEFSCENNQLEELPKLPINLEFLDCSNNKLSNLEPPPNLRILNCNNNRLTVLPRITNKRGNKVMGDHMEYINCRNNLLTVFPKIPLLRTNLKLVDCRENPISVIDGILGLYLYQTSVNQLADIKIDVNNLSLNSLMKYEEYLTNAIGLYESVIDERKQTLHEVKEREDVENLKLVSGSINAGKNKEIPVSGTNEAIQPGYTDLIKQFVTTAKGGRRTKKCAQKGGWKKKWTRNKNK
jgi:Leucine-rich repeat (LRR) protein